MKGWQNGESWGGTIQVLLFLIDCYQKMRYPFYIVRPYSVSQGMIFFALRYRSSSENTQPQYFWMYIPSSRARSCPSRK